MKYNTEREHLKIAEYGRHIQKMVDHLLTLEDKEKRTKTAYAIIKVMEQMVKEKKGNAGDLEHKLWDHLHIISGMQLNVDAPYEPPHIEESIPEAVTYSDNKIRYRFYGKNTEKMIEKISEYEEGPEKDMLIKMVANHLKKQYLLWNKGSVDDETIFGHLTEFSNGKITASEDVSLESTKNILFREERKKQNHKKSYSIRKDKSRLGGRRKKRY